MIRLFDLIYIVVTLAFFALMILYVRACERLGRSTNNRTQDTP